MNKKKQVNKGRGKSGITALAGRLCERTKGKDVIEVGIEKSDGANRTRCVHVACIGCVILCQRRRSAK